MEPIQPENVTTKPKTRKPTSVANAEKARLARAEKKRIADEQLKRQIEMMYSDESSDEEIMYVPATKKKPAKRRISHPIPIPTGRYVDTMASADYQRDEVMTMTKRELEEMRKELAELKKGGLSVPPTPQSTPTDHVMKHLTNKILNF